MKLLQGLLERKTLMESIEYKTNNTAISMVEIEKGKAIKQKLNVKVETVASNKRTIAFYEKLGFKPSNIESMLKSGLS